MLNYNLFFPSHPSAQNVCGKIIHMPEFSCQQNCQSPTVCEQGCTVIAIVMEWRNYLINNILIEADHNKVNRISGERKSWESYYFIWFRLLRSNMALFLSLLTTPTWLCQWFFGVSLCSKWDWKGFYSAKDTMA